MNISFKINANIYLKWHLKAPSDIEYLKIQIDKTVKDNIIN